MVESYDYFCPIGEPVTRATVLALCLISTRAGAVECYPATDLQATLYNEGKRQLVRANNLTNELQVFVDNIGNYSMIIVTPDKQACIVATGTNWKMVNWNE